VLHNRIVGRSDPDLVNKGEYKVGRRELRRDTVHNPIVRKSDRPIPSSYGIDTLALRGMFKPTFPGINPIYLLIVVELLKKFTSALRRNPDRVVVGLT